ncbi:MAG: hypothetical protein B6244_02975 [Candidatus Cloacimonetes bacterium 4572_55]|nr:MAG: hypothetical protein B6244_02975 [Candidatus Cloacimonetes bacterium 4572_55]
MSRFIRFFLAIFMILWIWYPGVPHAADDPPTVSGPGRWDISPPLRNMPQIPPRAKEPREIFNYQLPLPYGADNPLQDGDPVRQSQQGSRDHNSREILLNFDGIDLSSGAPPDPVGDVGANHYIQMVNSSFAIWDKQGTLLYGPVANRTLWQDFGGQCEFENDGDPIVVYDHLADRWILTQFAIPDDGENEDFYECIAVSQTGDPTGTWYRYGYSFGNVMPDYPKFGIWPDGYYMSANEFYGNFGAGAIAFDRDAMLNGDPDARMVYFSRFSLRGFLPADLDGPPPPEGTPNYFARISGSNQIQIWEFDVDWDNPENSTFSLQGSVVTAYFDPGMCFGARDCIPQPDINDGLDAISDRLMYSLQYRNFGEYQTMVVNHTVDVDFDHAGVRWYELRNYDQGWEVHQQSTFAPDDQHRWMGSAAMNGSGDIALGYSLSSERTYPSSCITGRQGDDPLNEMTYPELVLAAGGGSQSGSGNRWGDYSMMTVDPIDDETFWYTNEYISRTGSFDWDTRIAAFTLGEIVIPNFEVNRITGHAPLAVHFTDLSVGYPDLTAWEWDFDNDGEVDSEEQNPSYVYEESGTYTVRLTASNESLNQTVIKEDYILVFNNQSAVEFNAWNSYIQCPATPELNLTDNVTIEAWINPYSWGQLDNVGFGRIIDKMHISLFLNGVSSPMNDHSLGVWLAGTEGRGFLNSPPNSLTLNAWQHVAVTYQSETSEVKMYINGEEQEITVSGGTPSGEITDNSEIDLVIGASVSLTSWVFDGIIDELRIWDHPRSVDEIQIYKDHYLAGFGSEEGLIGYWRFDEGYGIDLADFSGNNHGGRAENITWVFGREMEPVAIEDQPDHTRRLPQAYVLYQNYPNPFNPMTMIRYDLPKESQVSLKIYNSAGQSVRSLVDSDKNADHHQAQWDGRNDHGEQVAGGVYFYRFRTESGFDQSKRMVLLK